MRNRTHWVLFVGLLCAATSAHAQGPTITISSLQAAPLTAQRGGVFRPSPSAPPQPDQLAGTPVATAAITTGTPAVPSNGFVLLINGTNLLNGSDTFDYVQWTDPAGGSYQIGLSPDSVGAYVYSVAAAQIQVYIPPALYSTAVTSPDSVTIQVFEFPPPSSFNLPLQTSNIATFTLNPPLGLTLSGAALPPGVAGNAYSQPFFYGGTPPYGPNSLVSGALPPGLPVPTSGQLLAGTPTTPGTYSFTLSVADEWGNTKNLTESLLIVARLQIVTTGLPPVQTGSGYSVTLGALGGFPPYTWSATGLPASLTLNSLTGALTGIAPAPGGYIFSFTVVDSTGATASATLPETFTPPPLLFLTTSPLPGAVVGTPYSMAFQVTGGVPGYRFSLVGGSLPGGLTLSSNGVLAGIPTAYGQFSFSVQVSDSAGNTNSLGFILNIRPAPLAITTGALPPATVGTPISITFAASGGAPPYSFSGTGFFPPGAQLSGAGVLTAPAQTAAGSYTFLISVADTQGNNTSKSFTLTVSVAALVITTTSPLANATVGTAYSAGFAASGGIAPYTWTAIGVPAGLSFSSTGALSGTPTAAGSYTLSVTVTDSSQASPLAGPLTATGNFALTVSPAKLTITTTSLANGTVGVVYLAGFSATGGVTPYTWSLSGLPAGLAGNSSGAISGTPTAIATATVTATVTDSTGTKATTSLPLTVTAPPLAITTSSLPNGVVGTPYSAGIGASGGIPPYTWTVGGLPSGISLSGSSLSGSPTAAGSFQVSVAVKDSIGATASASFPVTIALPALPPVTVTGVSSAGPASQPPIQTGISSPFPVPITVNLTLTFAPISGADDPGIQFSTGGRTAQETIAAGSTLALPALAIQTGTVAGTITITAQLLAGTQDITPNPAPSTTIVIPSMAPVITKVSASTSAGGFTISVVGYATSRQVTQAVLQFTPAAGTTLSSTTFTIPTTSLFTTWYGSTAAAPYGSQFTLTQPFTVSGSTSAVTSVSVTLSNSQGNSNTVTAPVP